MAGDYQYVSCGLTIASEIAIPGLPSILGARATDRETMRIDTMRPQHALMSLVSNTYGNYLLDGALRAEEFDLLSRVVEQVPVRHLTFAHDIERLRDSCQRLAELAMQEAVEEQV